MINNLLTFSDCDFMRSYKYVTDMTSLTPVDLAGSEMHMMVRSNASSATVLIEMSTVNDRIVIDFLDPGVFSVRIPFSELSVLTAGTYVHSLIRKCPDGRREQVWYGTITHAIGPTRWVDATPS